MSSPVWRRRRAGRRLQQLVRQQRRLLPAFEHSGHGLSPTVLDLLDGWRDSLQRYDADRRRDSRLRSRRGRPRG